jgi:hypothetical protein
MWDVMNEPTCTSEINPAADPEKERRKVWTFIHHAVDAIKSLGARQPITCGVMTSAELPAVIDKVDVVAWHNYTPQLRQDVRRVRALCESKKKPCHLNEIVGYNSSFASAMPEVHEEKVGWFFWELMYGKTQFSRGENPIQGLIYPDGTCRDAAEVAWVLHPGGTGRDPQQVAAEAGFPQRRWTREQAWDWYRKQPWLCGVNYIPGTACNTTEIWQAESFDEKTIERELGWARQLGLNWLRVNFQYLVWKHDPEGFKTRVDRFLQIAERHGLRIMFVLFDDCTFGDPPMPEPVLGKQRDPIPGMIMSSWTPSPGHRAVSDRKTWPELERFVKDVLGRFGRDKRVLLWDLYNEPGNSGMEKQSLPLVEAAFAWARQVRPEQPLSVGLWTPALSEYNRRQTELSDVITFHVYTDYAGMREAIRTYKAARRPVICTEWMTRQLGGRFATELPLFKREGVGWCSWGLANGRSQCQFPWWSKRGDPEPKLWFTDVLRRDGTPYDPTEIEVIRKMTADKRLDFAARDYTQPQPEPGTVLGTDPVVRYSAGWTLWSGEGPLNGKLHYNNTAGGTAEVTLEGTTIWLVHKIGPDCGIAELLLDGKPAVKAHGGALDPDPKGQAAVDTYSPNVEWNHRTLVARGLRPGKHTLKILVTGRRHAASTNTYVQLVAFEAGP